MQPLDDSSRLAAQLCEAIAEAAGLDPAQTAAAQSRVQTLLAPLVAAAIAGRAAGQVAHELRNPLAVIATSASLLGSRVGDDERAKKHVQRIDAQVKIAASLAHELLDAASARAVTLEPFAIDALVRSALDAFALEHRAIVTLESPDATLAALADRRRTLQILHNLLANARQAAGESAAISLVARPDGPHVLLLVQDNGPGVAPELRARLFEQGATGSSRGHGFGLHLSRELARAQGGELSLADSAAGACFVLQLMRAPEGAR